MRILKAKLGSVGMIPQIAGSQPGGYCLVLSGISLGIEGPGALPLPLTSQPSVLGTWNKKQAPIEK